MLFRDISPVLADPAAFRALVDAMAAGVAPGTTSVVAIEARGFLLGAAIAYAAGVGLVCVRKPGKLPVVQHRVSYTLEYGSATLELPAGSINPGDRVVVVDDVLATGGTIAATRELVEHGGGTVAGVSVVLELTALGGRAKVPDLDVTALLAV